MYDYKAKVTSVHDGDTFEAVIDLGFCVSTTQTFRMLGINAPELKGVNSIAGKIAGDFLRGLILDKEIIIQSHKPNTKIKQEKYGRWLAEIWVEDIVINVTIEEMSVNDLMVKSGLAIPYMV